jgi:ABC-2 type transport system permease protein
MKARTYRSRLSIEIAIVIAVLVFVNLLSLRLFARADFTQGKVYSISESTKKVLGGLDDVVSVKVYFSKKLPPYLTTLTRQVRDLLDEYEAFGGGKLVYEFSDPADDKETQGRVRMMGIPQVQLNVIAKDKTEVMAGYLGIAVLYGGKSEAIPVVQDPANLEYDLTSAILKVTSKEPRVVGYLTGHHEPDINNDFASTAKALKQEFELTAVATAGGKPISQNVGTLIIAAPESLSAPDLFAVDQFVMRGGKLMVLLNAVDIAKGSLEVTPLASGLDSLLAHYGIAVRPDLIVDPACGTATFSAGYINFTLPYPYWPMVVSTGFDKTSPISDRLERAVFPWTSSIDVRGARSEGREVTALARSSAKSWVVDRQFDLNPQQEFKPVGEKGPQNVAVLVRGKFTSYFAGKAIPAAGAESEPRAAEKIDESPETQIIVIGDSRFLDDGFLSQYPDNRVFFMNAIDWLALGESLIGIRSRALAVRPLKEIGEKAKTGIRLASTLGVPLLVIVWGLGRRYMRLRGKQAMRS